MRLIDADALKEDLTKWFPQFTLEGIEPKTLFKQILKDIDNAPTIEMPNWYKVYEDVKSTFERPQGEWIENVFLGGFVCSNCNGGYNTLPKTKYCPLCGADMRGGEES